MTPSTGRRVRVSVSGLDGSGKSSQLEAMGTLLEADHTVDRLWVPFNIWPQSMLRLLPGPVRFRIGVQGRTARTADDASVAAPTPPSRPVRLFWHLVATVAAVSAGVNLRRQVSRLDAEVAVLDRYRLDSVVKLKFWYPDTPTRWLAWIVMTLAPAPDLEFLLRVAPETAHARKPEQYSVRQLTRQACLYDEVVALSDRGVVLAGEDPPDEVTRVIDKHLRGVLGRG